MVTLSKGKYIRDLSTQERLKNAYELLRALVIRDFKARYRRSQLGIFWNFAQPLLSLVVFVLLRMLFDLSTEGSNALLFALSAILPWQYFVGIASNSASIMMGNAGIFRKVAVQRILFLLIQPAVQLVDLAVGSTILLIGTLLLKCFPGWYLLWLIPLVLLLIAAAIGVGMIFTSIGIYRADILAVSNSLFQVWFFATPVYYSVSIVPEEWQWVFNLNPMTGIILGFRSVWAQGVAPDANLLLYSLAGVAVIWILAWTLFRRLSPYFADVL